MEHTPTQSVNPHVDYEPTTLSPKLMAWIAIGMILTGILTTFIIIWVWEWMDDHATTQSEVTSSVMASTVETPTPRIQPSPGQDAMPWEDLRQMQEHEYGEFKRRGWVNETNGQIVIPDSIIQQVQKMSATTKPAAGGAR